MTDEGRAALVARWLELTRVVLPGMADAQGWPIRLDHCFMRVFLDCAMDGQWDLQVKRPAITHMTAADLHRAVQLAELAVREPERLPGLNRLSLAWRQAQRRRRTGAAVAGT